MVKSIIKRLINSYNLFSNNLNAKKVERKNKYWLKNNSAFNNCAQKDRVFIIGNGPSLKDLDFTLFDNEDVFTVNDIANAKDFEKLNIKYHFWADPAYFNEKYAHIYRELMIKTINHHSKPICFVACSLDNPQIKMINDTNSIIRYPNLGYVKKPYLFPRLDKPSPGFYNVIQYAMLTAIAMGYKKIYLLGCEQTSIFEVLNTRLNRKYDVDSHGYDISNDKEKMLYDSCVSYSVSFYLECFVKIFKGFEYLDEISKYNNVAIYNCTDRSLLETYPKANLYEVLKE